MSSGGSAVSSRYIWYSDVPGGVFRTHGSSAVPVPEAAVPMSGLLAGREGRRGLECAADDVGGVGGELAVVEGEGRARLHERRAVGEERREDERVRHEPLATHRGRQVGEAGVEQ